MRIILASSSPRRRELLLSLGFLVDVIGPHVNETPMPGENPHEMVIRLAQLKADAVRLNELLPVVSADTIVLLGDEIIGKPTDDAHAHHILSRLSGRQHEVLTGFSVRFGEQRITGRVSTKVKFRDLRPVEIGAYVASKEPMGKSGAYAIQGRGGFFVEWVDGSLTNVIGLPLKEVMQSLESSGVNINS